MVGMQYKDELPINTINKIRDILGKLGFMTVETVWKNSVDGFHSVGITIEGTNIFTNGKGSSREYALASAYGEMMERLQNQAVFRLGLDLDSDILKYQNFYYAPDEKQLSRKELIESKQEWINEQLSRLEAGVNIEELMQKWQAVSYETVPGDFIALPYMNIISKQLSHIPIKMISKMYMSNGMCAGNTLEEALVQGIAEILERNVNKRIIKEKLVPPTIPRTYIDRFPKIAQMISAIEAKGNFEIIVKDCSLGLGFPVVGIVYINKDNQSYFVKFGAHPVFEVAAERTLTELLQGQDIRHMLGVREFVYKHNLSSTPDNIMGIMVNGSGVYPTEFFSNNYSYQFCEFCKVKANTNKELLLYLVEILQKNGYSIYVRDASYLGFPSFHIIIPGLSEMEAFDDYQAITEYAKYNKLKRLIRGLEKLDEDKATEIINLITELHYDTEISILELLNLPADSQGFPWYYSKLGLFLTALYYWKGDRLNAYETFNRFLSSQLGAANPAIITYYKCVRDYMAAHIDNLSDKDITAILRGFYQPEVVRGVMGEFGKPTNILSYMGQLKCWNYEACGFKTACQYSSTVKVYRVLKQQSALTEIKQNYLSEII